MNDKNYEKRETWKLEQALSSMRGQPEEVRNYELIEEIEAIIESRGVNKKQNGEPRINSVRPRALSLAETQVKHYDRNEPFDVMVARRYSNKWRNAKKRGIEFDLSLRDFVRLMKQDVCYYSLKKMSNNPNDLFYRTVERIDSKKGYTKANCVCCSKKANAIKNVFFEGGSPEFLCSIEELENMIRAIRINS